MYLKEKKKFSKQFLELLNLDVNKKYYIKTIYNILKCNFQKYNNLLDIYINYNKYIYYSRINKFINLFIEKESTLHNKGITINKLII